MSKRLQDGSIITCPAGEPARLGSGVFCKIEGTVIEGSGPSANVATIKHYCTGCSLKGNGFTICPSWRVAREADMTQQEASTALQRAQDKQIDLDNEAMEEFEKRG